MAFIDFAKAYIYSKLLNMPSTYGIIGNLLQWIERILTGRSQQARVSRSLSNITKLSSGVVLSSVSGPLICVLFINDIGVLFTGSNCACELYADDSKLHTEFPAGADHTILHGKLNDMYDWSVKWQPGNSHEKCNLFIRWKAHKS